MSAWSENTVALTFNQPESDASLCDRLDAFFTATKRWTKGR